MEDVYVLGIANDYTPPSPFFNVDMYDFKVDVGNSVDCITKISCCANGCIEEIFKSMNSNYASVHVSIDIRIDYMCSENNMNFYIFTLDKLIYVNLGDKINKKKFSIQSEVLDLGVVETKESEIYLYALLSTCLY